MPPPALIAEWRALEDAAHNWTTDEPGVDDEMLEWAQENVPSLIAALESAEAENVEAVDLLERVQHGFDDGFDDSGLCEEIDQWLAKHKEQ